MTEKISEATYENILIRQEGKVGIVQINRPKALNALNGDTMREIITALEIFDEDEGTGCMVLTGNEKAFAAGADIKQMAEASAISMLNSPMIGYGTGSGRSASR
jgi:enoyl-CoA hydratase